MKPLDYIKNWIERNKVYVPLDSAKYEYHSYSETHFLKIEPNSILKDEKYEMILSDFIFEFDKEFLLEGLCLIGEDSLTKLGQPIELIPQISPDIAPIYQKSVFITDVFHSPLNTINSDAWDMHVKLPATPPATWNVQFDFLPDTIFEFSSVIVETKLQNSIEEPYSTEDEYINQAA